MLKIIKDSTLVPTPIVDLKLDSEPRQGSTDPVTSEGVKRAIDGAVGDASAALQQQIDEIAEKAGSGYIPKGEATVATLNALSGQENGDLYTMTDSGTLTDGSLAVVAGDTVAWDATNSVWYKAMDYAPRQYGTNEVHNLTTTITAFRTGDYIAVDWTSGTAKMSKDDLLKETAENVKPEFDAIETAIGLTYNADEELENSVLHTGNSTQVFNTTLEKGKTYKLVFRSNGNVHDASPAAWESWFAVYFRKPDGVTQIQILYKLDKGETWIDFTMDFTAPEDGKIAIYSYVRWDSAIRFILDSTIPSSSKIDDIEELLNMQILSSDIVFDASTNIFDYDVHGVTNNKDIDVSTMSIVDNTGYLVSGKIPLTSSDAGIWKGFYSTSHLPFSNFKVILYSGDTPVHAYSYTNGGDNYGILIAPSEFTDYNVDGVVFSTSSVDYNWETITFQRDCAYLVKDDSKRAFLEKNGVNLKYFPREAGETDDAPRIKRAIKVIRYNALGGVLYIPDGDYVVNSSIYLGYWESVVMADGCNIRVGASFNNYVFEQKGNFEYMSRVQREAYGISDFMVYDNFGKIFDKMQTIRGGTINCNGLCYGAISMTGFRYFAVDKINILNPKTDGIKLHLDRQNSYEAMVTRLHIYCTQHDLAGNIGVNSTADDNHFTDIVVTDCTIGFKTTGGANRWTRCHHWNGPISESLDDSVSFDTGKCILTDCYSDTAEVGFKVSDAAVLIGCRAYWNTYFHLDSRTIYTNNPTIIGCVFDS